MLGEYGFDTNDCSVEQFGSGLINHTWTVERNGEKYILQKINDTVFKHPADIAHNIDLIGNHLSKKVPEYFFTSPKKTISGKNFVYLKNNGYYRVFPFVKNSRSLTVVETPDQAYEAAKQFGKFTKLLSGIDIAALKITLPSFHDLSLRYSQYKKALEHGNPERISLASGFIEQIDKYAYIAEEYAAIKNNPDFKLRVTHHDTKISNVLFDKNDKGICVIDLDTVMPGYFISDVGDMMRTYLCPVSEEEKDFSRIEIRDEFYYSIVRGYREQMEAELTEVEKNYFFYSGTFMIYMQALRFFTDYLNNDVYYGEKYDGHNFVRAGNQLTLLQKLIARRELLEKTV